MTNLRAFSRLTVKSVDEVKGVIEGVATTPTPDRVDDIVDPEGAQFSLPLPLLWQHDSLAPVGEVARASVSAKGIRIRAQIAASQPDDPPSMRFRLEEAVRSVSRGLVRGLSIGFRPLEISRLETGGLRFIQWDWYELSLVTIPANVEATIANIKRFADDPLRPRARSAFIDLGRSKGSDPRGEIMKTIGERIAALDKELAVVNDKLKSLGRKELEEETGLNDEDKTEFKTLDAECAELEEKKARLLRYESLNGGARGKAVDGSNAKAATLSRGDDPAKRGPARPEPTVKREGEEGLGFARAVKCYAQAEFTRTRPADVASQFYKDRDPRVGQFIAAVDKIKGAVTGGNIGDADWAGDVAGAQDLVNDFLTFLRAKTLLGRFGQNGIPALRRMPLNSALNGLVGGLTGFFVGEGAGTPVSKGQVDNIPLLPFEAAGATVISKKNLRFANVALEMQLRDDLVASLREVEDKGFADPSFSASASRPASITNGLTALSSAGDDAASVRADLQQLLDALDVNMSDDEVVILMHSRLARAASLMKTEFGGIKEFADMTPGGGALETYPVIASNNIPLNHVIAVHASSVAYGDDDGVDIEADPSASIHMDGATTQSSATPTATSVVSMRQTRSVYMQATHYVSWKKLRADCVSYIDDATWNGALSV